MHARVTDVYARSAMETYRTSAGSGDVTINLQSLFDGQGPVLQSAELVAQAIVHPGWPVTLRLIAADADSEVSESFFSESQYANGQYTLGADGVHHFMSMEWSTAEGNTLSFGMGTTPDATSERIMYPQVYPMGAGEDGYLRSFVSLYVTIPYGAVPGVYTLSRLVLTDGLGYSREYSAAELQSFGVAALNIVDSSGGGTWDGSSDSSGWDTASSGIDQCGSYTGEEVLANEAPLVQEASFSAASIDTASSSSVTLTVKLQSSARPTDVTVVLGLSESTRVSSYRHILSIDSTGTTITGPSDGLYTVRFAFSMPRHAPAGVYVPETVFIANAARQACSFSMSMFSTASGSGSGSGTGGEASYGSAEETGAAARMLSGDIFGNALRSCLTPEVLSAGPPTLEVRSSGDTQPPQMVEVSFSSRSIDTLAGPQRVNFTVSVKDEGGSGISTSCDCGLETGEQAACSMAFLHFFRPGQTVAEADEALALKLCVPANGTALLADGAVDSNGLEHRVAVQKENGATRFTFQLVSPAFVPTGKGRCTAHRCRSDCLASATDHAYCRCAFRTIYCCVR